MSDMQPAEVVAAPLATLLDGVLTGVQRAVAGQVGTAVSIAHPAQKRGAGRLQVLAATGVGQMLTPITTGHLWGPSLLVATNEEPIVTANLWQDPRWPHLSLDAVFAQLPERHHDAVARVRGVVAVPGVWDDQGVAVLSVYLDRPADDATAAILARHERLVTSAITIADTATRSVEDADRVLDALASRAVIEQAKGAIMTLRRCDAVEAWATLRRASQEFNIKLRELALALIEHIGRTPAQQPEHPHRVVTAGPDAHRAAALIWQTLIAPPPPGQTIDGAAFDLAKLDGHAQSIATASNPDTN